MKARFYLLTLWPIHIFLSLFATRVLSNTFQVPDFRRHSPRGQSVLDIGQAMIHCLPRDIFLENCCKSSHKSWCKMVTNSWNRITKNYSVWMCFISCASFTYDSGRPDIFSRWNITMFFRFVCIFIFMLIYICHLFTSMIRLEIFVEC